MADTKPLTPVTSGTRAFVGLFLVAFLGCGLLGIEAWPLTGWRLFADVRTDHQEAYRVFAVDPDGREYRIPFGRLPSSYRGVVQVLNGLPDLRSSERDDVCDAWAEAVERAARPVEGVRVYRVAWELSERDDGRASGPIHRQLVFVCGTNLHAALETR
jgi:hypothetical protein